MQSDTINQPVPADSVTVDSVCYSAADNSRILVGLVELAQRRATDDARTKAVLTLQTDNDRLQQASRQKDVLNESLRSETKRLRADNRAAVWQGVAQTVKQVGKLLLIVGGGLLGYQVLH